MMPAVASGLRLPDFVIAGAPRSGTTWLYRTLDRHPDVEMAKPVRPEPKFFLVDEIYEKGLSYYSRKWFADVPPTMRTGEKSTNYLESETAARRMHADLPESRLIFLLREPADRALSNWRWSVMNGIETLGFEDALLEETRRESEYGPEHRYSRPFSYYSRGLYRDMLEPYVELFGMDRLLILRYEDLRDDPVGLARSVHEFLGVEGRAEDAAAVGTINPSVGSGEHESALADLRKRYRRPNRQLADLLGDRFEIWE